MATVAELAAISRASLARPLAHGSDLFVATPTDEQIVHGAFDRGTIRRGSGGAPVRVGAGSVWIQLVVAEPTVDAARLLNRLVRPLLAALTKIGPPGRYFGRDWVSVDHAPVAAVGFSFDESNGRAFFEAIVAAETRFDVAPRPSFRGQVPRVLGLEPARVAAAVTRAYESTGAVVVDPPRGSDAEDAKPLAWTVTAEEPIGRIGAAREGGRIRFGGELMTSRQAIEAVESGADPSSHFFFGVSSEAIVELLAKLV